VVYTLGFASSRREARQLVKHNHFLVNGKKNNIPSFNLEKGDVVEVREVSRGVNKVLAGIESAKKREIPGWLDADHGAFKGTMKDQPSRDNITLAVEENMIVEYYSR
jgi:small subunit ribosomal protein S4